MNIPTSFFFVLSALPDIIKDQKILCGDIRSTRFVEENPARVAMACLERCQKLQMRHSWMETERISIGKKKSLYYKPRLNLTSDGLLKDFSPLLFS